MERIFWISQWMFNFAHSIQLEIVKFRKRTTEAGSFLLYMVPFSPKN